MFKKVKNGIGESRPTLSNVELLAWIEKLGLARAFEADNQTFYLLEIGAGPDSEIDPLELMMAYEPSGVVCYFSAMAFHSLTSQIPSHHHVSVITESSGLDRRRGVRPEDVEEARDGGAPARKTAANGKRRSKASPFGKIAFSYSGISYYLTRRTSLRRPGADSKRGPRADPASRRTNNRSSTHYKPQNCGGPAVVLEAWHEAATSGRLDEERLVDYLDRMDYPSTSRRVGAMLRLIDYLQEPVWGAIWDEPGRVLTTKHRTHGYPCFQVSIIPTLMKNGSSGCHEPRLERRWKSRVLDEVFAALAADPGIGRCLVFKGARVLNAPRRRATIPRSRLESDEGIRGGIPRSRGAAKLPRESHEAGDIQVF